MDFAKISPGRSIPNEINVVIEIPARHEPVKYEIDKESGVLMVDRFLETPMFYPCNYGYIPQTLSADGDPVDVLVITPAPLTWASVIPARPIGILHMIDEKGEDAKILALPIDKICQLYRQVRTYEQLPQSLLNTIAHFFEHYKDLEEGKWVKVKGWSNIEDAHKEIVTSIDRYQTEHA